MKEMIDIFDADMNHLGVMEKWEAHEKEQWHKNAHIWVTDGKNVLVQLRSPQKRIFPNKWDISAAGHFGLGDTPLECAKREWEEELGLPWEFGDVEANLVKAWGLCNGVPMYEHVYFFFVKGKPDISKAKFQKEEVAEVKWLPFEEFKRQIKTDLFCPFDDEYWEIVLSGLSELMD
jgi:isopentenyldiphosphate isomerase